ncbi:MAG TPA: SprB repeat-containing protein, partial [Bacteroidia bacterium]|nr:SprB repeat-containing protein [Bacteroidia bacterium]
MKIKNTHKSILLVFACWALLQSPVKAQQIVVPPSYVFFHGDSLDGFNWPLYLNASELKRFSNADLLIYLKRVETAYVHKKYTPLVYLSAAHSSNNSHRVTAASPCNNVDFEDGNYTNWNGDVGENDNSAAALTVNIAGIVTTGTDAATTACSYQTLVTTGTDPYGGFPMLDPGGGSYAVRLGSADINENYNWAACSNGTNDPGGTSVGEQIYQSYAVTTANAMFTYNYAVVLNDGGHTAGNMPYFRVEVLDNLGNPLPCLQYYIECSHGVPPAGFLTSALKGNADPASAVYYLPWTSNTLNLKPYIGTTVTIRFTAAGCTVGGHFGYAYVDATCSQVWPTVAKTCNTDILTAPPGGTAYSWTGPGVISGASSQTATANVSGTYTVVVTTGPGCTYILDTAITVPAPIVINTTSTPAICTASNGSASVTSVTGGTPPFTFSWNSGQTTSTINNITSGSYTVTVTDVNGCPQTATVN